MIGEELSEKRFSSDNIPGAAPEVTPPPSGLCLGAAPTNTYSETVQQAREARIAANLGYKPNTGGTMLIDLVVTEQTAELIADFDARD